jgi:hypothetical protein
MFKLSIICYLILKISTVLGHGLMTKPVAMSAKPVWANDPTGVKDYDAHSLFCGGVRNSYVNYNQNPNQFPKCGICGDSYRRLDADPVRVEAFRS